MIYIAISSWTVLQCGWSKISHSPGFDPLQYTWSKTGTRYIHLYVLCRSVDDQDQNWIERSKPFWGNDQGIKVTSKLLNSTNQKHVAAILLLTLENQSDQKPQKGLMKRSSDQAHFIIAVVNTSTGDIKFVEGSHTPSFHPFQGLTLPAVIPGSHTSAFIIQFLITCSIL